MSKKSKVKRFIRQKETELVKIYVDLVKTAGFNLVKWAHPSADDFSIVCTHPTKHRCLFIQITIGEKLFSEYKANLIRETALLTNLEVYVWNEKDAKEATEVLNGERKYGYFILPSDAEGWTELGNRYLALGENTNGKD